MRLDAATFDSTPFCPKCDVTITGFPNACEMKRREHEKGLCSVPGCWRSCSRVSRGHQQQSHFIGTTPGHRLPRHQTGP